MPISVLFKLVERLFQSLYPLCLIDLFVNDLLHLNEIDDRFLLAAKVVE